MISRDRFRMVEILSRSDLAEHPVWADYHGDADSEWIRGWGVDAKQLAAELERYDYCGRAALFPVLEIEPLPERPNLVVSVELQAGESASATEECELSGYLIGEHAIVVFAGSDAPGPVSELCLNKHLVKRSEAELVKLGQATGLEREALLALRYSAPLRQASGATVSGSLGDYSAHTSEA